MADREPRWTTTFARLPEEKRSRVLEVAKRSFAAEGFAGANVNRMAEEAGISVGSMYKYFRTKEDIFLAVIEGFHDLIARTIDGILAGRRGFFERLEALLRAAAETSRLDPDGVRIYIDCTTEELSSLAARLSGRIEAVSAERYRRMVEEGQAAGEVSAAVDPGWAAFFLDDILLMVQFSFGSEYYRERLRVFTGGAAEPEEAVARLLALLGRALRA